MHFSSVTPDLKPVWKCIIYYSPHWLLLTSSWANPLSKNLKPWKCLQQCLSFLRNLNRSCLGEACHGWKNLLLSSSEMNKHDPSWTSSKQETDWTTLMSFFFFVMSFKDSLNFRFCVCSVPFALFVHRGLRLCCIALPRLCLRWFKNTIPCL